jgi:hypothetical protein
VKALSLKNKLLNFIHSEKTCALQLRLLSEVVLCVLYKHTTSESVTIRPNNIFYVQNNEHTTKHSEVHLAL